jgi:hypothetical protein
MLLFALLLGLALHFISDDKRCKAGAEPVWANSQSMAVFMQADMAQ